MDYKDRDQLGVEYCQIPTNLSAGTGQGHLVETSKVLQVNNEEARWHPVVDLSTRRR